MNVVHRTLLDWAAGLPLPPGAQLLGPARAAARDQVLAELRAEAAEIKARHAAGDPGWTALLRGTVTEAVARHRVLVRALGQGRLRRGLARLDGVMPTERVELMDRDDVPEAVRSAILETLERTHGWIGTFERAYDLLGPFLYPAGLGARPTRLLDIASGHGAFPVAIAQISAARVEALEVTASDINPDYLPLTARRAAAAGVVLENRLLDALGSPLPVGEWDIITCSNALHHFGPGDTAVLLARAIPAARRAVVLLDPYRAASSAPVGVAIFALLGGGRPGMHDTLVSIRKSFVLEEVELIAALTPGAEAASVRFTAPGWWSLVVAQPEA